MAAVRARPQACGVQSHADLTSEGPTVLTVSDRRPACLDRWTDRRPACWTSDLVALTLTTLTGCWAAGLLGCHCAAGGTSDVMGSPTTMSLRLLALHYCTAGLLLSLEGAVRAQQYPRGSPNCPCISPWAAPLPGDNRTRRDLLINRKHDFGITNQTRVRVPLDYGASVCRRWDNASHHPDCLRPDGRQHESGAPEWCTARWCYVDASRCDRPHDQTDHAVAPADTVGVLHHSYETCGNLNAYTDERHYSKLRGLHLRVSMPGNSGSGYTLTTLPDGTRSGSVVNFMKSIAQDAGFTWEVVPIGSDSRSLFSSSFTACVHAVALGVTDMCIGNFWLTTQRMLIHPSFTSVLYDDEMVLVVKAKEEVNLWDRVGVPFTSTLTSGAWGCVLGTMLLMSFAMTIIEGKDVGDGAKKILDVLEATHRGNQQAERKKSRAKAQISTGGMKQFNNETAGPKQSREASPVKDFAKELVRSVYYGLLGLTAGAPTHEGRKPAGAVVILGFAVFAVLFLASFTGATAAMLIAQSDISGEVSSVSDVQQISGAKLCLMSSLQSRIALRFPSMHGRLVASTTAVTVMQDMDDGKCIGSVMFQDAWENCLTGACRTTKNDGSSRELNHCDKVAAGGSLMSTPNVMPVRYDLRESLSYMISRRVANNEYANFRQKAREQFLGPNLCPQGGAIDTSKAQIDAQAMTGPVAISLMCTVAGLVAHFLTERNKMRRLSRLYRQIDQDGDKTIDDQELEDVLAAMGLLKGLGMGQRADIVQSYKDEIDTDGDGTISFPEFRAWAEEDDRLNGQLSSVLNELRTLHTEELLRDPTYADIELENHQVKRLLKAKERLQMKTRKLQRQVSVDSMDQEDDKLFKEIDQNGDGRISWKEFGDWARKDENLRKRVNNKAVKDFMKGKLGKSARTNGCSSMHCCARQASEQKAQAEEDKADADSSGDVEANSVPKLLAEPGQELDAEPEPEPTIEDSDAEDAMPGPIEEIDAEIAQLKKKLRKKLKEMLADPVDPTDRYT
eukprot:COSAG01_NODE_2552_length_7463_cov_644.066947_2_plen_1015_part_00